MRALGNVDETVDALITKERKRQQSTLSMIAAENSGSPAVFEALASVFNDKTGEGYPGHRYHTGCGVADELEQLAIDRAETLFGADHANVQPHSGVNANLAVYHSVLVPGDRVLAMRLSHGGHLSHGSKASITGRVYQFEHYGVAHDSELLDYDQVRELARSWRPRLIVAGASSYPRLIDYTTMRAIADEVSAYLLVDMAHIAGLVAAHCIPSPVPVADFVTFTTYKTMMGSHGGIILSKAAHARSVDRAVFPGTQGAPSFAQIAAKAVCLKIASTLQFEGTQRATVSNSHMLAEGLGRRGYRLVTGGTDNHMLLMDLQANGLTGDVAEKALEEAGILVNRNVIPFDSQTTTVTSGLRVGTASPSARGMRTEEIEMVASLIDAVLSSPNDAAVKRRVGDSIRDLCARFPLAV